MLQGFAPLPQHFTCPRAKTSHFLQCPAFIIHLYITVADVHNTDYQCCKEIQITAKRRMCLQFSEGQEIKSIHLFNCRRQGQHGHRVAVYGAGIAVLPACFQPGREGSSALHGAGRAMRGPRACLQPMAGAGWMWQISVPSAG